MTAEVVGVGINNMLSLPQLRFVMDNSWRDKAHCAPLPKSIFFNYKSEPRKDKKEERINDARSVCRACPVKEQCYEFAVKNYEPHGIWAGTLPEERRELYNKFFKTGILETLKDF